MLIRRRAVAQGTRTPPELGWAAVRVRRVLARPACRTSCRPAPTERGTVIGTVLVTKFMKEEAAPLLHLPRQRVRVRIVAIDAPRDEVPALDRVEPRVAHGLARRQSLLVVVAQQLGHKIDTLLADLRRVDSPGTTKATRSKLKVNGDAESARGAGSRR